MSFTLPPNSTLQYSNTTGDINHQGIQSSNINGTEILPAFPTTSTGTSTGNYNHLGIDGQNNNKWDFLNSSGTLDGGYNFWNSSSTQAPLLLTSLDNTGITVDRSIASPPPSLGPPISSLPGDNSHINFSVDLTQPPYNMVFGDLTANPVFMTQSNGFYSQDELVYAFVTTPFQVQLFKNDANTNPIPPNAVPSGFPTADTTGLTVGLPVFAFGLPGPSVTKTAILTSEALFIKNDPFFAPVALSASGLSVSDVTGNNSFVEPGIITVQDSGALNTQINAYSFNINGNAKTVAINSDNMTITDAISNNSILSSSSLILNSYYNADVPLNIIDISGTTIQINDNDQGISSTLSSGGLILNDGSNNTQIYPQLINLNGNGIASSLSPTNLTFNGRSYAQNQVVPTLIYSSPVIYADGHDPATSLSIRANYGYNGWYYKNAPPNTSPTNKINWYFPPCNPGITTVADLKGIAISFFNGNTTSNDDTLFLTVYTVVTGSNDYAPGFFHSANTYVFNQSITPIANTNYQGVAIVDKQYVPFNYETQIQYQPSTVNNPRGTYAQGDKILAVVIGTNSASATNSVELVVNKLNLIYANFTQSYLLIPP